MRLGAAREDARRTTGYAGNRRPVGRLLDEGDASSGIDQPVVDGDTGPRPGGADRLHLRGHVQSGPYRKAVNRRYGDATAADIRPIEVGFEAEHDGAL